MLITHVQLHELLADCCYHAAITPASVQAYYEHEHLLLVLDSQLAAGCADNTCMCAIAWEQEVMEKSRWFTGALEAIWNTEISSHSIQIKHDNCFLQKLLLSAKPGHLCEQLTYPPQ